MELKVGDLYPGMEITTFYKVSIPVKREIMIGFVKSTIIEIHHAMFAVDVTIRLEFPAEISQYIRIPQITLYIEWDPATQKLKPVDQSNIFAWRGDSKYMFRFNLFDDLFLESVACSCMPRVGLEPGGEYFYDTDDYKKLISLVRGTNMIDSDTKYGIFNKMRNIHFNVMNLHYRLFSKKQCCLYNT